jgi:hypothetical protein
VSKIVKREGLGRRPVCDRASLRLVTDLQGVPVAKTDLEYQTTFQAKPSGDGRMLFTRRRGLSDRLAEFLMPLLWVAVFVALLASVFWL